MGKARIEIHKQVVVVESGVEAGERALWNFYRVFDTFCSFGVMHPLIQLVVVFESESGD